MALLSQLSGVGLVRADWGVLFRQPIICLDQAFQDSPHLYEVLLRIPRDRPTGGTLPPDSPAKVIKLLEQISEMPWADRWIISEVFSALSKESGIKNHYHINISAQSLWQYREFELWLGQKIDDARIDPSRFSFELTESVMSPDSSTIQLFVAFCESFGIDVFLDDFGSGCLGALELIDVDCHGIKIDSRLLRCAHRGSEICKIQVCSILEMAQIKGVKTIVAEGVECLDWLPWVVQLGFTHVQGFGVGRPELWRPC